LYSKDIPITGVEGLGRPTLLEVEADGQLVPMGMLTESVPAVLSDFEPRELMVYPPGAVELSLPVEIVSDGLSSETTIRVTYMACNETGCKPPVMRKEVRVNIPSADALK
jgi:hypothetical protein